MAADTKTQNPHLGSPPTADYDDWPIRIRELEVLRRVQLTPKMVRVTLGGPGLAGFESHLPDEHMKLVFPDAQNGVTRVPTEDGDHLDWPKPFPPTREYTVRHYDPLTGEVDIDFVVHPGGLASEWAQHATVNSTLWVAGPRSSRRVPEAFGFIVLVADETGLPAVARWLEELPDSARGAAFVEVDDAAAEQPLRVPAGFRLTWLHRTGAAAGSTTLLADAVSELELPDDTFTYMWAGAEAGSLKPVRRWARQHGIGPGQSDISGYWKRGTTNAVPTGTRALLAQGRHALDHLLRREH